MSWPEPGHYTIDPTRSRAKVFTYKKGLLSAMGHDLEMHTQEIAGQLTLEGDSGELSCTIQLWNLSILPSVLDGFQKREAESTMRKKVLRKEAKATAVIEADVERGGDADATLTGTLSLLQGRSVEVELEAHVTQVDAEGFLATTRHDFRQSDHGIKPYKGMMGALQLKDEMEVELEVYWKRA